MAKKVILVWFRNDLRMHDNEILSEAVQKADIVIPVYVFDPRYFGKNAFGFYRTGVHRAKFLLETVAHLKHKFQETGADLLVFRDRPEDILGKICARYDVGEVYHHREVADRETRISERVEAALWREKINLKHFIGHTLYHKEDLPVPIRDIPEAFAKFRKKVEKESFVRPVLPTVRELATHPHLEETALPTLAELGFDPDALAEMSFGTDDGPWTGGEENGLEMVARTLPADGGDADAYHFVSPYLSLGAVSPARYYHEIKAAFRPDRKKKHEKLIGRLLWRDYFRFMLKKHPNIFFKDHEPEKDVAASVADIHRLLRNGCPDSIINGLLHGMKTTGNLPCEHRELLAAYLIQERNVHHLAGAALFEDHFIDYAPASNYGYWLHLAGHGCSLKDNLKDSWREMAKRMGIRT